MNHPARTADGQCIFPGMLAYFFKKHKNKIKNISRGIIETIEYDPQHECINIYFIQHGAHICEYCIQTNHSDSYDPDEIYATLNAIKSQCEDLNE